MFSKLKLVVVAASLLIGGVALAQPSTDHDSSAEHRRGEGGWHKRGQKGDKRGDKRDKRVGKLDGKRDPAQFAKRKAEMLAKFDTNKDGKLDRAERSAMQAARASAMFAKLDKNHDGVLSLDEAKPMLGHRGGMRGMRGPGKR